MNTTLATGYLVHGAEVAWTPGASPKRRLIFEVMIQADGDAEATPWRCEIDNEAEITRTEPLLTPGRGVALRAQLSGRPFIRQGVQHSWVRCLKVDHVEFIRADRGKESEMERTQEREASSAEVAP